MTVDQIVPEALRLSPKERAMLASSLWESIGDPYSPTIDQSGQEAIALAIQRDSEMESGLVAAISHHELMARLRA